MNNEGKPIFFLKTHQVDIFKHLFDSLKDIFIEVNLRCSEAGLEIRKINKVSSICCFVRLSVSRLCENPQKDYFCEYPATKPLIVGINVLHLAKLFRRTASTSTEMSLQINQDANNVMQITMKSTDRSVCSIYHHNFVDVDEEQMSLPDVDYDAVMSISSKYFCKQIKDIHTFDATGVEIKLINGEFILTSKNGMINSDTYVHHDNKTIFNIQTNGQLYQGTFKTKDLQTLNKFTSFNSEFTLKLKNDLPLVVDIVLRTNDVLTIVIGLCKTHESTSEMY